METVLGGVISKSKEISQDTIEDEVKSEGISTGINIVVNETPLLVSIAAAEDDAVKSAKIDGSAGAEGIQKLCDESIPSNAREELEEEKEREEIAEHLGLRQMKTVLGGVIKENKKKRMRRSQSKEISQDMVADEAKSDPETPPNEKRNDGKIKGWTAGPSTAQIAPPKPTPANPGSGAKRKFERKQDNWRRLAGDLDQWMRRALLFLMIENEEYGCYDDVFNQVKESEEILKTLILVKQDMDYLKDESEKMINKLSLEYHFRQEVMGTVNRLDMIFDQIKTDDMYQNNRIKKAVKVSSNSRELCEWK